MKPFNDDATGISFGEFTIENGAQRIACYGDMEITRDKAGLALAGKLTEAFAAIHAELAALAAKGELPDEAPPAANPEAVTKTPNPFR